MHAAIAAEVLGNASTRAKRCAGVTLERNRDSMTNGSVRRREVSGVHG
jgi:hypothetical protein